MSTSAVLSRGRPARRATKRKNSAADSTPLKVLTERAPGSPMRRMVPSTTKRAAIGDGLKGIRGAAWRGGGGGRRRRARGSVNARRADSSHRVEGFRFRRQRTCHSRKASMIHRQAVQFSSVQFSSVQMASLVVPLFLTPPARAIGRARRGTFNWHGCSLNIRKTDMSLGYESAQNGASALSSVGSGRRAVGRGIG